MRDLGKLALGLHSGRYSGEGLDGIGPRMFKQLLCAGSHFAGAGQQDAEEFFGHFVGRIEQQERVSGDPTRALELTTEQALRCLTCQRVKRTPQRQKSLAIPLAVSSLLGSLSPLSFTLPSLSRPAASSSSLCLHAFLFRR